MRNLLSCIIMIGMIITLCVSPASAALWQVDVSPTISGYSDFSMIFNDDDDDLSVDVSDIQFFSGITLSGLSGGFVDGFYDEITGIIDVTIGSLTLVDIEPATTGWDFVRQSDGLNLNTSFPANYSAVPVPGAVWLLGSGIIGLVGIRRKIIRK